jgi:hypothetical protein
VIASAVIPTAIANAYFMPKHLLPKPETAGRPKTALIENAAAGD